MKKIVPYLLAIAALFFAPLTHAAVNNYFTSPDITGGNTTIYGHFTVSYDADPSDHPDANSVQLFLQNNGMKVNPLGSNDILGSCITLPPPFGNVTHSDTLQIPVGVSGLELGLVYSTDLKCQTQDAGSDVMLGDGTTAIVISQTVNGGDGTFDTVCTPLGSSTVCSSPWDYEKGSVVDILLVCIGGYFVARLLLKT